MVLLNNQRRMKAKMREQYVLIKFLSVYDAISEKGTVSYISNSVLFDQLF